MEDQGVEAILIHVRPNARVEAVPGVHELCLKLVDVVVLEVDLLQSYPCFSDGFLLKMIVLSFVEARSNGHARESSYSFASPFNLRLGFAAPTF